MSYSCVFSASASICKVFPWPHCSCFLTSFLPPVCPPSCWQFSSSKNTVWSHHIPPQHTDVLAVSTLLTGCTLSMVFGFPEPGLFFSLTVLFHGCSIPTQMICSSSLSTQHLKRPLCFISLALIRFLCLQLTSFMRMKPRSSHPLTHIPMVRAE